MRLALLLLATCLSFAGVALAQMSGNFLQGSVGIGYDADACDAGRMGFLRYNSSEDSHEFCDGAAWRRLLGEGSDGTTSLPAPGDGYFVLTNGTTDGAIGAGGMAGADAFCLADLTANNWMGKADAVSRGMLDSSHVKAFLCGGGSCQTPIASSRYYFAVSNNPTIGGAYFDAEANTTAPNNAESWAGVNYFGGSYTYWTGRNLGGTATNWGAPTISTCAGPWNATGSTGRVGSSGNTDAVRWASPVASGCGNLNYLICFVHSNDPLSEGFLEITPTSQLAMDVTGPGNPAYGSVVTFTVENTGSVTSQVMTTNLTNATNFEIVTDDCVGQTLAAAATCDIDVRPKSAVNATYNGQLIVDADNTVTADMYGDATGFPGTGLFWEDGVDAGDIHYSSGNVGIGTDDPDVTLDIFGTDAVILPRGDTSQRPTEVDGMIRYNSQTGKFEGVQGGTWTDIITSSAGAYGAAGEIQFNSGGVLWSTSLLKWDAVTDSTDPFLIAKQMFVESKGNTFGTYSVATSTAGVDYSGSINALSLGGTAVSMGSYHAAVVGNAAGRNYFSLLGIRNKDTVWDTSPVAVVSGDYLPHVGFAGQTNTTSGTGVQVGASIGGIVDNTVSSGVLPTAIVMHTTTTNTASLAERMRITSTGNVGIGSNAPGTKLTVDGAIQIGGAADACAVAGDIGRIRFDGTEFEICQDPVNGWEPIAGAGGVGACDTTQTMSTAGSHNYTVPASFGTITIKLWGAGGGGGGLTGVGADGGASSILSLSLNAGGGGGGAQGTSGGTAGVAGTASGGDINTNGAAGTAGVNPNSGAGGNAPAGGGAGGASVTVNTNGNPGNAPGGGAGGASRTSSIQFGGGGGSGAYVEKVFTPGTLTPSTLINDIVVGAGGTGGGGVQIGGNGGTGRISITCTTVGAPPVGDDGEVVFLSGGQHWTDADFVFLSTGRFGVGTDAPEASADFAGTDALIVPRGNTAQRPTEIDGMIRFNSQTGKFEGVQGGSWTDIITGGATPGGADRQIQFNSGGTSLGASADLVFTSAGNLGVGTATPLVNVDIAGEARIGYTGIACDADIEGSLRYNSGSGVHQYCDGGAWVGLQTFSPAVTLAIIPNSKTDMNVTGPGSPAYGATDNFQVKNFGSTASATLSVVFSDPDDYFDIVSDGCTGEVLDPNEFCNITIRPKASGNRANFQATLTIPENNAPQALLSGAASGFGCVVGNSGGGGKYAACGAYNLVATPSGCTDSTTPTCAGGTDALTKTWGVDGDRYSLESISDGPLNSVNLMVYVALEGASTHPAAEYCMNMNYGGYSDWYLPAQNELVTLYTERALIGGWASTNYWSSTEGSSTQACRISSAGAITCSGGGSAAKSFANNIRCVRRETQALPSAQYDTTPDAIDWNPMTAQAAASTADVTAGSKTIAGITGSAAISISGGGSPEYQINGGAWTSTAGTVANGDTINIRADAPAVNGNRNKVTLVVGGLTTYWYVGAGNTANTRRVFVTSTATYNGNISGVGGADTRCVNVATAAGLGTNWAALIGDSTVDGYAINRTPIDWGTLVNMNGNTVATSWNDLWDGSIANAINRNENNVLTTGDVLVGAASNGRVFDFGSGIDRTCTNWSNGSATVGLYSTVGSAGGVGSTWIYANSYNTGCSTSTYRLYCIESGTNPADTTPNAFQYDPMTKQAAASTADVEAASKVITGIDDGAAVSISGGGSPEYRINGGAWTATAGTIDNGDTLEIRADAPASANARNKVTITVGTFSTSWYVGAGNSANTRRIFVTPGTYQANLSGSGGADTTCANAANAVGLGTNWKAILSENGSVDAYAVNRIPLDWGTLVNMNGDTVAASWDDMWDGTLVNPIGRDPDNNAVTASVWTGTASTGRVVTSSANCASWTTATSGADGGGGLTTSSTAPWTANTNSACNSFFRLYCIESAANPADGTPVAFYYLPMTKQAAASATDVAAASQVIAGIDDGADVSISGGGTPEYRINGGSWTTSAGTIDNGDTLEIRADAPAVANTRNKVTITVGTYSTTWYVGAGNSANTKRIFVTTAAVANGNIGGAAGADSTCSTVANAAGLGTGWVALISEANVDNYAVNRVPLNWGTLNNMNGAAVATSWDDLWDGTLGNPINRSQTNVVTNVNVWTGTQASGVVDSNPCSNWTTSGGSAAQGTSGSTTSQWLLAANPVCSTNSNRLYCIEQ